MIDEKVLELIFEYFRIDFEKLDITKIEKIDILEFFTDAAKNKMSGSQVTRVLRGSMIEEIRIRLVIKSDYKPYPVRLGGLKPLLQREAFEKDITLQRHILLILRKYRNLIT